MRYRPSLLLLPALLASSLAWAEGAEKTEKSEQAEDGETPFRYVIGAQMHVSPEYAGASRYDTGFKPIWALQWGRWHISTSGGTALLGFGSEVRGDGASTDLLRNDTWRFGAALRIDNGRDSGDASTTTGLDDVQRTLRGRFYGSYTFNPDWRISAALSQDLLGHEGGMIGVLDLGWRLRQSARSEWTAGLGITAGDGTNMRSYFGVSPAASARTGLPVYEPGAGLRDIHMGMGWTYGLTQRWIAFSGLGASYSLGPAADSPLTQKRFGGQLSAGLAYRN